MPVKSLGLSVCDAYATGPSWPIDENRLVNTIMNARMSAACFLMFLTISLLSIKTTACAQTVPDQDPESKSASAKAKAPEIPMDLVSPDNRIRAACL